MSTCARLEASATLHVRRVFACGRQMTSLESVPEAAPFWCLECEGRTAPNPDYANNCDCGAKHAELIGLCQHCLSNKFEVAVKSLGFMTRVNLEIDGGDGPYWPPCYEENLKRLYGEPPCPAFDEYRRALSLPFLKVVRSYVEEGKGATFTHAHRIMIAKTLAAVQIDNIIEDGYMCYDNVFPLIKPFLTPDELDVMVMELEERFSKAERIYTKKRKLFSSAIEDARAAGATKPSETFDDFVESLTKEQVKLLRSVGAITQDLSAVCMPHLFTEDELGNFSIKEQKALFKHQLAVNGM